MKTRLLYTESTGAFKEMIWEKPDPTSTEIEVKAAMTGVCRSDIDMMQGNFGPLPLHMQGHEGLGIVTKVGADIGNIKVGDYVATRGEPAYADYYNCRLGEFVVVPELHPRYIIEPVACGVNIIEQPLREICERSGPGKRMLILGSGFLAWVAYNTVLINHIEFEIDVVGNSNKELWGDVLKQEHTGEYDVIIDLSSKDDIFTTLMVANEALIVFGAQKKVTTDFSNLLWRACTIIFPSPRTKWFRESMQNACLWIQDGRLNVDKFWTRGYDRNTEWQEAFQDGLNRPEGYSRGYIKW